MSPRSSGRGVIEGGGGAQRRPSEPIVPGWPRERSRRAPSQAGRIDPLAPPPRRDARPRPRRASSSSSRPAVASAGPSLWLGVLAFLGAGGLVVLAAELTLRVLGP